VITHLKDRKYYEDLYDKITVKEALIEADAFLRAREQFYEKAQITDKKKLGAMEFWWERLYWWLVELPILLPRWENRDATINEWMRDDKRLDERLENTKPYIEPTCTNCGKQGLRLVSKQLLRREGFDERSVLFIFNCPACKKRSTYWEDGTEWESPVTPCPQCKSPLTMDVKVKGRVMTTTNTCENCGHVETEKVRLGQSKEPEVDPDFERDKKLFCLSEERAKIMLEYRPKWEEGMRMLDEEMEREADKELYDTAAKVEQLKIPQLIEKLRPAIEKAGYMEVNFDKPNIIGYVTIEFSCMDSDSSREDAKSRKTLKKVIESNLKDTNWRLMSDGISYRLGYLTGRLRAYEGEAEMVDLLKKLRQRKTNAP
jgi:hypothetical protein